MNQEPEYIPVPYIFYIGNTKFTYTGSAGDGDFVFDNNPSIKTVVIAMEEHKHVFVEAKGCNSQEEEDSGKKRLCDGLMKQFKKKFPERVAMLELEERLYQFRSSMEFYIEFHRVDNTNWLRRTLNLLKNSLFL